MVRPAPPRRTARLRKVSVRAAARIRTRRSPGHLPDKGSPATTAVLPRPTAVLRKVTVSPKVTALLRKVTASLKVTALLRKVTASPKVTALLRKVTADLQAATTARPARVGMAPPLRVTARPLKVTADRLLTVHLRVVTTPVVIRRKPAW